MPIELAEVAAGLPLAASFAMAGGFTALREARRRTSLNEAIHELRRPLQVLALALPVDSHPAGAAESSLRLAAAAVERLELEVNGGTPAARSTQVDLRSLIASAAARWRPQVKLARRSLSIRWQGGEMLLPGNEVSLSQALDNLINNACVHGGGTIAIECRREEGCICLVVRDEGRSSARADDRQKIRRRLRGRCRHGHGLRVVERVAAEHGGSFALHRCGAGVEARLLIPGGGCDR